MARESWGRVENIYVNSKDAETSVAQAAFRIAFLGIVGDTSQSFFRSSIGVKDRTVYGIPTRVDNQKVVTAPWRQVSLVSVHEMEGLARDLGISASADEMAAMLKANMLVACPPGFTQTPPGTAIHFYKDGSERPVCALKVEQETLPCDAPGHTIAARYPEVDFKKFKPKAMGRRGLVSSVLWLDNNDSVEIIPGMKMRIWNRGLLLTEKPHNLNKAHTAVVTILATLNDMKERSIKIFLPNAKYRQYTS